MQSNYPAISTNGDVVFRSTGLNSVELTVLAKPTRTVPSDGERYMLEVDLKALFSQLIRKAVNSKRGQACVAHDAVRLRKLVG